MAENILIIDDFISRGTRCLTWPKPSTRQTQESLYTA